eukprot:s3492_g3.t1
MQSFSASGFGLHKLCSGLRQVVHSKYMAPAEERLQLLENDSQSEYKESGEESASESDAGSRCRERLRLLMRFFVDLGASVVFWWALFSDISDAAFYGFLAVVGVAMIVWRFYRALYEEKSYVGQDIPYTCAHLRANDRDLFLVATVHISPRAPRDVETVIQSTKPTVAMIELDEERLDRMRKETTESGPSPPEATLQPAAFKALVEGNVEVEINTFAQRAIWNSGAAGENFSGEVVYRPDDAYGLEAGQHRHPSGRDGDGRDFLALVRRGSGNGEFAPFALKAHNAAKSGASALLVVNSEETLPMGRIGVASIWGELRIACTTGTCDFPPLPLLLLNQQHGEELVQLCESGKHVVADFTVKSDPYPRRSLPKKICQGCALILSGIGVMYGIIQCFAVEVGGEFLAAESTARELGIRCVCIDVDLNRFWSRLGWALVPSPCNVLNSFLSWLAFPRVFFQFLFPPFGSIDTVGSTVLHGASFSLKTWIAFFLAGLCASFITNGLLRLLGSGMEAGAEQAGVVESSNRDEAQAYIMLAIEMYMLPQIYLAVAASRDEAMYQSMVRKCKEFAAESLVVVVGAGHANGILQRVRQSGL